MSNEIVPAQSGGVPAIYKPAPLEIDASDVALPRIYFAHPQSEQVQEHDITTGAIFSSTGKDDPDPQVMWDPKAKGDNPGVLFHVLGMYKAKSATIGGKLETFSFSDPDAPADAWVTYNYTIVCPEHDTDVPYKLLLTRTKASAAKQINTVLMKNAHRGPAYMMAFRMSSKPGKNDKGSFSIPVIRIAEATKESLELAENMAAMIGDTTPVEAQRSDEPAI